MTNDCVHDFGHFLVFCIELQMVVRTSMILSSPVWISSAGMLSMPSDLPIFKELTTVSISCLRIGSCGSLFSLIAFSTAVSPVTGWLYSSVQYSVHLLIYIGVMFLLYILAVRPSHRLVFGEVFSLSKIHSGLCFYIF